MGPRGIVRGLAKAVLMALDLILGTSVFSRPKPYSQPDIRPPMPEQVNLGDPPARRTAEIKPPPAGPKPG
ncbi:hypothetical protein IAI18_20145 [Acetobacteraceae bacterium H6797]|nr:hypothetical protein [Acetobacteraceae bacterium H6797]